MPASKPASHESPAHVASTTGLGSLIQETCTHSLCTGRSMIPAEPISTPIRRKIDSAEDQRSFVQFLRAVPYDELSPDAAVRCYQAEIKKTFVLPKRALHLDLPQTPKDKPKGM